MNLAQVMTEVGAALGAIGSLKVWDYPAASVTAPAAVVGLPDSYVFDQTAGRGNDRLALPVWVVVGRPTDPSTRDRLGVYCNGSGAESVKEKIETYAYTACDTPSVVSVEFESFVDAGVTYASAKFVLDIRGDGA